MSKSHPKTGHLMPRLVRQERGSPVAVETRKIRLDDGSPGAVSILALDQADVPDRSYVGEACAVEYAHHTVRLVFAQPKLDGKALRSLLIISMTPGATSQFMHSVNEMHDPAFEDITKALNIEAEPLIDFPRDEPDQTASLVANVVAMAVHGRETALDFYHASAFSQLRMLRVDKSQLYLEPVVRVNVRTALVLSLVERLAKLSSQFPSQEPGVAGMAKEK